MFLSEGHKKDNKRDTVRSATNAIAFIDAIDREDSIVFVVQKTEKLTTAIYLITDFLDTRESFRWKMRDDALSLMSFINSLMDAMPASQREHSIRQSLTLISRITSLLDFAVSVRFVSQMNYSILKGEYKDIYGILFSEVDISKPKDNLFFKQGFFDTHTQDKGHAIKDEHKRQNKIKDVFYDKNVPDGKETSLVGNQNEEPDDDVDVVGLNDNNDKIQKDNSLLSRNKKTTRQEAILRILGSRGEISIKDIVDVVPDCSEKTIQRELILLIKKGAVRRIGERRWSKYVFITQSA